MTAPSLLEAAPTACCADETWRPIPAWPHHGASSCGRVRSVTWLDENGIWHLGAILPQHPDKRKGKGYLYVNLRDGKRHRRAAVAVVVLEAHRGLRPFPDWEACHNDGVRTDNHLAKLRWDSRQGNLADQWRHAMERKAGGGVTEKAANRDEPPVFPSRQPGFPRMRFRRPGRYSPFRGHALKGTGSFSFHPPLSLVFPSVKSSLRSLRSLRDQGRTS